MSSASREPHRSPIRGIGLGLRAEHEDAWRTPAAAEVPFAEVLADNYLRAGHAGDYVRAGQAGDYVRAGQAGDYVRAGQAGDLRTAGPALRRLLALRETHPLVLHGVGMSLGSTDELDRAYVGRVGALARDVEPAWISEHLAWTSVAGRHHHELLPLPFIEESVATLARNIRIAQDLLGRRLVVENSVRYLAFGVPELTEAEFVVAVLEAADCDLLLDVSNLLVNARNHGSDPHAFLSALPAERVRQMHLGGYDDGGPLWIDAHASAIAEPTWQLFAAAQARFPGVPTTLEWDRGIPPFEDLLRERERAAAIAAHAAAGGGTAPELTHAA